MTASEAALSAAFGLLGRLPGAQVHVGHDISWTASGRPMASLNHVHGTHLGNGLPGIDARIDEVLAVVTDHGTLPATWWVGPTSTPSDLADRLVARGLEAVEPEYGMVVELGGLPLPEGDVSRVDEASLDEWLSVMGRSYGWSDPRAIAAWTELYRRAMREGDPSWPHVLVRANGVAVACASAFPAGDQAFITNVGTVPEARGKGFGTAATLGAVAEARQAGYRRASLTASLMGRPMYAQIGFVEEIRLDRYVWPGHPKEAR